ncbi:Uncharacterized protein BM_BM17445 [Brugia malayi]|uniref:Uncharacterized protein n=1 Tax=Brugia malayi TaxID=6279 RepID=A0A4E9F9R2_BRUMA|nr:Uncharacterized protein BM_BM17445 [Brugia malayi]VIO92773.1 Uncharacterized protein BM_BM17445 [Brugia malayi]
MICFSAYLPRIRKQSSSPKSEEADISFANFEEFRNTISCEISMHSYGKRICQAFTPRTRLMRFLVTVK